MTMMAEKYVRVVMEESQAMMDENPVDLVQVQQLCSHQQNQVSPNSNSNLLGNLPMGAGATTAQQSEIQRIVSQWKTE